MHRKLFDPDPETGHGIHTRQHFLSWHRWYILQYENLLRQVDCKVTVPYWDWSVVSRDPWGTTSRDLWHSGQGGFGGKGNCVNTGPFREGEWQLPSAPAPRCLSRGLNGNPPDSVAIEELLKIPPTEFQGTRPTNPGFEDSLRIDFHNEVHGLIGGTMASKHSANAPEFFLHHGFIDKVNH
jgi:hypothetical protein